MRPNCIAPGGAWPNKAKKPQPLLRLSLKIIRCSSLDLWHREAQSCVQYQLVCVEEQLLNKMAWGTALSSSMPQSAPRLPLNLSREFLPIHEPHAVIVFPE